MTEIVSKETVAHIANLAKIKISDEKIASFQKEMNKIQDKISFYEQQFARYDSLTVNCKMNSRFLEDLQESVKNTNSLWLNSLSLQDDKYSINSVKQIN